MRLARSRSRCGGVERTEITHKTFEAMRDEIIVENAHDLMALREHLNR